MIKDINEIVVISGNKGKDCPCNGEHTDERGVLIECRCDECDHLICCITERRSEKCKYCKNYDCIRKKRCMQHLFDR